MASLIGHGLTDPYDSHEDTDNPGTRRDRQDRPAGGAALDRPWPSGAGGLTVGPAALRLAGPGNLGPRLGRRRGGVRLVLSGPCDSGRGGGGWLVRRASRPQPGASAGAAGRPG